MSRRVCAVLTAIGLGSGLVYADDLDRAQSVRDEVNHVIDILAASTTTAASQTCVSALDELHTTDRQLKQLTDAMGDGGGASQTQQSQQSEVDIARDVLATDLHDTLSTCRPDAVRACAAAPTASVAKLCEVLHHDIETEPAKR